jgi:hypothetical protein
MVGSLLIASDGPSLAAVGHPEDGVAALYRPWRPGIEDTGVDDSTPVMQRPRQKPLRKPKMSTTFRAVEAAVPQPGTQHNDAEDK